MLQAEERSVWCWGIDSLYEHRRPLLLCAFALNLTAIACITAAAVAIGTSPSLSAVGWATATASLNHIEICDVSAAISIQTFLGLKGYYSRCAGELEGIFSGTSGKLTPHSGNFCSAFTNYTTIKESPLCHGLAEEQSSFKCELVTASSSEALPNYCSACEDTSRDCVGTGKY